MGSPPLTPQDCITDMGVWIYHRRQSAESSTDDHQSLVKRVRTVVKEILKPHGWRNDAWGNRWVNAAIRQACQNAELPNEVWENALVDSDRIRGRQLRDFLRELRSVVVAVEQDNPFTLPPIRDDDPVSGLLHYLFGNGELLEVSFPSDHMRAILLERDPTLFKEAREKWQALFDSLASTAHEQTNNLEPHRIHNLEVLIGNILATYSYLHPEDGELVTIPLRINGIWQSATYQAEWIQMTHDKLGSPYSALGLKPVKPTDAPPLLVFMGTTFPSSRGAYHAILADLPPSGSVGESIYSHEEAENVGAWLENMTRLTGRKARVSGISLGGNLTLLTVSRYPDFIESARAYVPAGLDQSTIHDYKKRHEEVEQVDVEVYLNHNDPVSYAGGRFPPSSKIFLTITPNDHGPVSAHAKCFAGQRRYARLRVKHHAAPRGLITRVHAGLSPILHAALHGWMKCWLHTRSMASRVWSQFSQPSDDG